jgi:hypothetical protein
LNCKERKRTVEKIKHYFTESCPFIDEKNAFNNDPSVLGYYFNLPLWNLLLLDYLFLSADLVNHLANLNLFSKYLLMPLLCQALSRVVTGAPPCLLNQSHGMIPSFPA